MAYEDRFKQPIITTLAKRAANRCSNPDCGAITSGPTSDPLGSVNVGEAAHIYGANPGSARFDPDMTPTERSAISNAIWLCGNCHKLIDDDADRYPAGLLFEWQREHERKIAEQVGKIGADIRKRYEERHLEEFGRLSYLGERLLLEKDTLWEYRLTAEVLRFEMTPILRRWHALKQGLYIKPRNKIEFNDFISWILNRSDEISSIASAFNKLLNTEFNRSFGEPGIPGSDIDIVTTCRLFSEMCQSALIWEETVRFVTVDDIFHETLSLFVGVAGSIIEEAEKVPAFFTEIINNISTPGHYELNIVLTLPDDWGEKVEAALKRAQRAIRSAK